MTIKTDLHTHLTDTGGRFSWKSGKQFGYSEEAIVQGTLNKCFSQDTDTLIAVVDFYDDRANAFFNTILKSLEKDYFVKERNGILEVSQDKKKHYFIQGQEISTDKGHLLLIGSQNRIKSRKLDKILAEISDENPFIIADHPLVELKYLGKILSKIAGTNPRFGLREDEIGDYRNAVDALELNPHFPGEYEKIISISNAFGIPLVANSDSHTLDGVFSNYNLFDNLSFESLEELKSSIREEIKSKNYLPVCSGINSIESLRHELGVGTTHLLNKLGLIGRK